MKKIITIIIVLILVFLGALYFLGGTPENGNIISDPRNATYVINGESVALSGGVSETQGARLGVKNYHAIFWQRGAPRSQ